MGKSGLCWHGKEGLTQGAVDFLAEWTVFGVWDEGLTHGVGVWKRADAWRVGPSKPGWFCKTCVVLFIRCVFECPVWIWLSPSWVNLRGCRFESVKVFVSPCDTTWESSLSITWVVYLSSLCDLSCGFVKNSFCVLCLSVTRSVCWVSLVRFIVVIYFCVIYWFD